MLVFVLIAAVLLLILFLLAPSFRRRQMRPWAKTAFAHRGLHGNGVCENTLAAFEKACQAGFGIELDVQLSRDGCVMVFHDDTLQRMLGDPRRVDAADRAELQAMVLEDGSGIPTFEEVLSLVDGRVPLLIEFKCRTGDVCARLCPAADAVLAEYKGVYWIQSFYPFVLSWYRKHRPDVCRGQLATAFVGDKLHMRMLGMLLFNVFARPDFVSYEWKYRHKWNRRICTALGAAPVGWTFRAEEEIKACKEDFAGFIFEGFLPKK